MSELSEILCFFESDMTLRWSCRRGDFLIWLGWKGLFHLMEEDLSKAVLIRDLWEMQDGDHVTLTNRFEDIPEWFPLHPSEVCDRLIPPMRKMLDQGYKSLYPLECANVWRIKAGDRLAWVGKPRPGVSHSGPVLSVVDFRECALIIGDNVRGSKMDILNLYGGLTKEQQTPEEKAMVREAIQGVSKLGIPRTYTPEWKVG